MPASRTTPALLLWLFLACTATNAVEDYCDRTGACTCTDGDCCAHEGTKCLDLECCADLTCERGACAYHPRFAVSVTSIDFGEVPLGSAKVERVTVTNVSQEPQSVAVSVEGDFVLDASLCPSALAPEASCDVTVRVADQAAAAERLPGTLAIDDVRPLKVSLVATTGTRIELQISGPLKVTSSPQGLDCPTACSGIFRLGAPVVLSHSDVPEGYFRSNDANCVWMPMCTLMVSAPVSIRIEALPLLQVRCVGAGSITVNGTKVCTSWAGSWRDGGWASKGTAVLVAQPAASATKFTWYTACEGELSDTCVLNVEQPISTWVRFE